METDSAWTNGPTLSAWVYDSPRGAAAGKVRLGRLSQRGALVVVDAATVTWVHGAHRPRIGPLHHGAVLGPSRRSPVEVLLGRLLFQHGCRDRVGDLVRELAGSGVGEEFLQALLDGFVPDASALVVLTRSADLDEVQLVIERGRARGDVRLLHATLRDGGIEALEAMAHRNVMPGR